MTRINTNVGSLIAKNSLARNNADLNVALTRLSTGLRINFGKDDPAGLIASEALRSDITSIEKAVRNSERANQMIATADSALGQVSNLLNDIRGLVVEAANTGALSEDQLAANQLQVDSSLEAINRIAQTTTFQGRRLLDGSLDFVSSVGSVATVKDARIDQANLGATGEVSVDVDISAAAAKAEVTATGFSAAQQANATIVFAAEATLNFASGGSVSVRATEAGTSLEGVTVSFQLNAATPAAAPTATFDANANTLTISVNNAANTTSAAIAAAVDGLAQFDATGAGGDFAPGADSGVSDVTDADEIVITAATAGPDFNNLAISVEADSGVAAGAPQAVYDSAQNTLTLRINDTADTALGAVAAAIAGRPEFSSAVGNPNGNGQVNGSTADVQATANTDTTGGGTLLDDLVLQVGGLAGTEVFNFQQGASINQLSDALNLVSDATGVEASYSGTTLTLSSTTYGSNSLVNVDVTSEGAAGTFTNSLSSLRATGTDIQATVNGIKANGDGNNFSINTTALDLSITVRDGDDTNFDFSITGGGALFQIGPDVVSNQQARLGIQSLNTAKLGGTSGTLYELASGEDKALVNDAAGAARVVDEVIDEVTRLRGRLGAFQRTTLETNINSLNDTMAALTEAESSIRDADFAEESSRLTRAQILVQSGTSVLAIANSQPQNVLALLR